MVFLTHFVLSATASCFGVDIFFQLELLLQKCRPQLLIDGVQKCESQTSLSAAASL